MSTEKVIFQKYDQNLTGYNSLFVRLSHIYKSIDTTIEAFDITKRSTSTISCLCILSLAFFCSWAVFARDTILLLIMLMWLWRAKLGEL